MSKVLVADDEPDTLDICSKILKKQGHQVFTARDGLETIKFLEGETFDILLLDLRMPGKGGMEILDVTREMGIDTIVITAYASIETAVEAMKKGALDYLAKPFTAQELRLIVEKTLSRQRFLNTEKYLAGDEQDTFFEMVGSSPEMQGLYDTIERIATVDTNILIEGETGTGKELVARAIHLKSPRSNRPFIPVNCGALPENLLETELFGHIKGAFTGAVNSKQGLVEASSGGTLFLDEVSETPPALQVKLLRVIQEKEFRPVGSTEVKRADVRIITATNRNLAEEVRKGRFREDLFYRISVIALRVPPLRDRREDIPLLVHHFIKRYNQRYHRDIEGVTQDGMDALMRYNWPGNIREIENLIERMVIMEKGRIISPKNLGLDFMVDGRKGMEDGVKSIKDMEKEHIEKVLKVTGWNRTRTAEILGIGRRTLYEKINTYGIKED
ncbi:MAG: hypothetical protein A2073_01980 [Deltaproteobacteria bacterium GWC2_42_11]|nr:MAG: hypothetical protein A2073_01980 [Deltaproteobacteria bacterium GWC2_42_11]